MWPSFSIVEMKKHSLASENFRMLLNSVRPVWVASYGRDREGGKIEGSGEGP